MDWPAEPIRPLCPAFAPRAGLAASVILHTAAGIGICLFASVRALPTKQREASFPIMFLQAAPDPVAEQPTILPVAALEPTPARAVAPALRMPARVVVAASPMMPAAAPSPATTVERPPEREQQSVPSVDGGVALAAFESRVHAAVQLAAVYPPAARMQHRQGRARIRFELSGTAVAAAAVAQSSQSALLDRAALDAVRVASMPALPSALGTRQLVSVWVDFSLVAED